MKSSHKGFVVIASILVSLGFLRIVPVPIYDSAISEIFSEASWWLWFLAELTCCIVVVRKVSRRLRIIFLALSILLFSGFIFQVKVVRWQFDMIYAMNHDRKVEDYSPIFASVTLSAELDSKPRSVRFIVYDILGEKCELIMIDIPEGEYHQIELDDSFPRQYDARWYVHFPV